MKAYMIEAFACSGCHKVFDIHNEAEKCCTCETCLKPLAYGFCEKCVLKQNIKHEEDRLRNTKRNVETARKLYKSYVAKHG